MTPTLAREGRAANDVGLSGVLRDRGLTSQDLSVRTGIPATELHQLESGDATGIRFDSLIVITSALNCSVDELLPAPTDPGPAAPEPAAPARPRGAFDRIPTHWRFALGSSLISVALVWVLTVIVSTVNPVDFLVYRYGSAAAIAGTNIYEGNLAGPMMPQGGLPFTYTPFAALMLLPTNLFGPLTAFVLWSWLTMAMLAWVIWRCTPRGPSRVSRALIALTLSGLSIVVAGHIIFGQINVLLMLLCLADAVRRPSGRDDRRLPPGVLTGVAAAIKLTPALFIVYFAATRQWSRLWWSIAAAGACTIFAVVVLPDASWTFFTETVWHLSDKVDLGDLFATSGNNSIQGASAYFGVHPVLSAILAVAAGAVGILAARDAYGRDHALHAAVIVGITACLVSPVSWLHHWVYLVPALIILSSHGSRAHRRFVIAATLVILATGPTLGDVILSTGIGMLWPIGVAVRESLLLIGVIAIVFLWRGDTEEALLASHPLSRGGAAGR